jgi:hypothetical protein
LLGFLSDIFLKQAQNNTVLVQHKEMDQVDDLNPRPQPAL